jgi:hypothetical protein
MLSKPKIEKQTLNCSKCNLRCSDKLIELPCFHYLCLNCKNDLKFRFYSHCKTPKIFLPIKNHNNNISKNILIQHSYLNRLKRIEKAENYTLELINKDEVFIQTDNNNTNFDFNKFIRNYFSCKSCKTLFSTLKQLPITLNCFHSICKECYDNRNNTNNKAFIECPECFIKLSSYLLNNECLIDHDLLDLVNKLEKYLDRKQISTFGKLDFFLGHVLEAEISVLREKILPKKHKMLDTLLDRKFNQIDEQKFALILGQKREAFLKILDDRMRTSLTDLNMKNLVYFRKSNLELHHFNSCGRLRNHQNQLLLKKIEQLHLNNGLVCESIHLESKNITKPLIRITGFSWLRQAPKPDFLIPYSRMKIISIYPHDCAINQTYRMKIANPASNSNSSKNNNNKHLEYEFNFKMKLEYCRMDYESDRLALFFERTYDREYCLKIFQLNDLNQIECEKTFEYFVENFLFSSSKCLSWSSLNAPFIRTFSSDLSSEETDRFMYDEMLISKYYSLTDANHAHLVLHNQDTIGVLCRKTCKHKCEINTKDYEDFGDYLLNEMHQQRMRAYLSQSKSEYFNVKLSGGEIGHLIVSTWCKFYIFDLESGALLAKNSIFLIMNNNWFLPNRMYVNKENDVVYFDNSTSFLTFI